MVNFEMQVSDDEIIEIQALCLQYNLSYEQLFVKLIKEHIIVKMRDEKKETWINLELLNQCAEMLLIDGHGGLGSKLKLMVNNIIN